MRLPRVGDVIHTSLWGPVTITEVPPCSKVFPTDYRGVFESGGTGLFTLSNLGVETGAQNTHTLADCIMALQLAELYQRDILDELTTEWLRKRAIKRLAEIEEA